MSDTKTRWAANLTDEQRAALSKMVGLADTRFADALRAAFAAKPRERVGWIDQNTFAGDSGHGLYATREVVGGRFPVRVRVTEILGDEEPQP